MPDTADAKVNAALAKVKANPLVGMNFRELFVSSTAIDNANDSVLSLVSNTLKEIGNSRYKYAGIIDKINLMEGTGAPLQKPTDVSIRRTFVGNMSKFLGEIVGLYQALNRMKKQIGVAPEEKTGEPTAAEPTAAEPTAADSNFKKQSGGDAFIEEAVNKMNEQAEKMRHLMSFNIHAKRVL
jgi:hypothetical protein